MDVEKLELTLVEVGTLVTELELPEDEFIIVDVAVPRTKPMQVKAFTIY